MAYAKHNKIATAADDPLAEVNKAEWNDNQPITLEANENFVTDAEKIAIGDIPTDHSSLTGLATDSHTQYHTDARGDARYVPLTRTINSMTLSANITISYGDVGAAAAGHDHSGVYSVVLHDHSGVYAVSNHDHSGVYSPVAHDHSGIYSTASHAHTGTYALLANGVTNGDSHDHIGGDGASITYASLAGIPATFAPSAHSHPETDITLSDVTTNNVSTTKHGLFPKLPAPSGKYLKDDLTWATIVGGGDVAGTGSSSVTNITRFDSTDGKKIKNSLATVDDSGTINIPTGQTYNINGSAHTHAYGDLFASGSASVAAITIFDTTDGKKVKASLASINATGTIDIPTGQTYNINGSPHTHAGGSGDVVGTGSSSITNITRFDSTDGKKIKNSLASIDDSGSINIPTGQTYKINNVAHTHSGLANLTNSISSEYTSSVSTAWKTCTSLGFQCTANTNYMIEYYVLYQSAATTTGLNFALDVTTSAAVTMIGYHQNAATTFGIFGQVADAASVATNTTGVVSNNVTHLARLSALVRMQNTAGLTDLTVKSEVNASQVKVMPGSVVRYYTYT